MPYRQLLLLLGLIVYQSLLAPFFAHTHWVNGVMVSHEHPYASAHDHTEQAYLAIDLINHTTGIVTEEVTFPLVFFSVCEYFEVPDRSFIQILCSAHPPLRAPPVHGFYL